MSKKNYKKLVDQLLGEKALNFMTFSTQVKGDFEKNNNFQEKLYEALQVHFKEAEEKGRQVITKFIFKNSTYIIQLFRNTNNILVTK